MAKSPCIGVCAVSSGDGLCIGCGRTLKQIAEWSGYSDEERERIMKVLYMNSHWSDVGE